MQWKHLKYCKNYQDIKWAIAVRMMPRDFIQDCHRPSICKIITITITSA